MTLHLAPDYGNNFYLESGGNEEILLLETQLFARIVVVVGVQDSGDGLGPVSGIHRLDVVPVVEQTQVNLLQRTPACTHHRPQSMGCSPSREDTRHRENSAYALHRRIVLVLMVP